jgi:segregation and condensation protein A
MKITDIEIGRLLEQYLQYVEQLQQADLEVSSAFLEMAARLVYIKTVSLLPRHEEAAALKKELEGQLIEYQRIKAAAALLGERYQAAPVFVRKPLPVRSDPIFRGTMDAERLRSAYLLAVGKAGRRLPPPASAFRGIVSKRFVSVTSRIVWLLRKLYQTGEAAYQELFTSGDRSEMVATFLAVLELMKAGRITMSEDNQHLYFNRGS